MRTIFAALVILTTTAALGCDSSADYPSEMETQTQPDGMSWMLVCNDSSELEACDGKFCSVFPPVGEGPSPYAAMHFYGVAGVTYVCAPGDCRVALAEAREACDRATVTPSIDITPTPPEYSPTERD